MKLASLHSSGESASGCCGRRAEGGLVHLAYRLNRRTVQSQWTPDSLAFTQTQEQRHHPKATGYLDALQF